ncbi:MAG: hypothetical protein EA001_10285 [Oscillatoriales cyanobacterium]|nr:MAG: hypothetical protein EA001_10285 [Oscillatoriales cyanobacterium]
MSGPGRDRRTGDGAGAVGAARSYSKVASPGNAADAALAIVCPDSQNAVKPGFLEGMSEKYRPARAKHQYLNIYGGQGAESLCLR